MKKKKREERQRIDAVSVKDNLMLERKKRKKFKRRITKRRLKW